MFDELLIFFITIESVNTYPSAWVLFAVSDFQNNIESVNLRRATVKRLDRPAFGDAKALFSVKEFVWYFYFLFTKSF